MNPTSWAQSKSDFYKLTYPNIATAGTVIPAPNRKTAPGRTLSVAMYTLEYSGP